MPVQSNGLYFFLKRSTILFCSLKSTFRGRLHLRGSSSSRFPIISPAKYLEGRNQDQPKLPQTVTDLGKSPPPFSPSSMPSSVSSAAFVPSIT